MQKFVHCVVVLIGSVSAYAARSEPPELKPALAASVDHTTLYLAKPDSFVNHSAAPLLYRELQRQALLLAARDELGLYTRDEVLREFDSSAATPPSLKVDLTDTGSDHALAHVTWTNRLETGDDALPVPTFATFGYFDESQNVNAAELESRRGWLKLLHDAGYTGAALADNDGPAPKSVDALLYRTSLFASLSAVQQSHAAVAAKGASPARLSAIVRGYANLQLLTRFEWSTESQVFAARALLYGQRMVVKFPDQSLSFWSRAYAEALVGFHAMALDDVATARRIQPAGTAVPPWAELIEPLCRYDTASLTDFIAADKRRAPLAALLTYVTVQQCGSTALMMEIGQATLPFDRACFCLYDGMLERAGVGPGRRLTEMPPAILARVLPLETAMLPSVPPEVRKAMTTLRAATRTNQPGDDELSDYPVELAAAEQSLVNATKVAVEPSLTLAGRMVQEVTFVHVQRRSNFIRHFWGIDASDYVTAAQPLVADHPYAGVVTAMRLTYEDDQARAELPIAADDVKEYMYDFIHAVKHRTPLPKKVTGSRLPNRAFQNSGSTAYDIADQLYPFGREIDTIDLDMSSLLRRISPYCPMIEAARIRDHGDEPTVRPELKDGVTRYAQQPATLAALATRLKEQGDRTGAEAALEQYQTIAGDAQESTTLAEWYLDDGNETKWLATLEGIIKRPDYGLDHAQAQVAIAERFMNKHDFKRALPYADAAEETEAYWAMKCDADCHRGLGDTATADRIMADAKEHYGH